MKKQAMVLLMVLILSGCSLNSPIRVGDPVAAINRQQMPVIFLNALSVFQTDNVYTVVIEENGFVQKTVSFSADRKCSHVQELTLIKNESVSRYMDVSLHELKEALGEIHADIGSGRSIPAYIAEGGYLICLEVENGTICGVIKRDLFTNAVMERLPQ